jgi:hypothetical protein
MRQDKLGSRERSHAQAHKNIFCLYKTDADVEDARQVVERVEDREKHHDFNTLINNEAEIVLAKIHRIFRS